MRKRTLDAEKGRAGAGMSGNKQEHLGEKKKGKISLLLISAALIGFYRQ
jgi:hypothetical protein